MRTRLRILAAFASSLALAMGLIAGIAPAHAAECLFTNDAGDQEWSNSANWSCGRVPLAGDFVTLDQDAYLTENATVGGLTLEGAGALIASPADADDDVTLTVKGPMNWTGGAIGNDGTERLIVDWQGGAGTSLEIAAVDPKYISTGGSIQARGAGTVRLAQGTLLAVAGSESLWSFYAASKVTMEDGAALSGDGNIHADDLTIEGESRADELTLLSIKSVRLAPLGVFQVAGGAIKLQASTLITGTSVQEGGRLITGAPLEGEEERLPTEIVCEAPSGCATTLGSATWEKAEGDTSGTAVRLAGSADSMPFVWSGGSFTTPWTVGATASMEVIDDRGNYWFPIRDTTLTIEGEMTLTEGAEIYLDGAGSIKVAPTGIVRHDAGASIWGMQDGDEVSTVTNNGTWIAQDSATFDPGLRNVSLTGTGLWDLTERGIYVDGDGTVDITTLKLATWSTNVLDASQVPVRLRKVIVTSSQFPAQVGQAVVLVKASQLTTTGMTTQTAPARPGFAYRVGTTSTELSVTLIPALSVTLECQNGCPTTAKVNQKFPLTWLVGVPNGTATSTVLSITWASGVSLVGGRPTSCAISTRKLTCSLGTVSGIKSIPLSFKSSSRGMKTIAATVTTSEAIEDPTKSTKTIKLNVTR